MTFFPMLVNTVAGLNASSSIERDLMRTYAANYWETLLKLRLPAAGPFIFNALKINSTLALIGAIVAEFFGTPIVGMGFRISTEVGKLNIDLVWAEIAVAALAGFRLLWCDRSRRKSRHVLAPVYPWGIDQIQRVNKNEKN
jgi:NitT/TauT family transport system permease protein